MKGLRGAGLGVWGKGPWVLCSWESSAPAQCLVLVEVPAWPPAGPWGWPWPFLCWGFKGRCWEGAFAPRPSQARNSLKREQLVPSSSPFHLKAAPRWASALLCFLLSNTFSFCPV